MKSSSVIYVAGHRGLAGSAIVRALKKRGLENILVRTHAELDLLDQGATLQFFRNHKIDYVFLAAARVGGISANSNFQADFLYENLVIATNVIRAAATERVEKLLFLGSSCIYPKFAQQPIAESSLLTGPLEPTNEGYAIAKIAGLKLCEMYQRQYGKRFVSAMPCNLYGPGDNFHPDHSHVIPGMMRRFDGAKKDNSDTVKIWGSGKPFREFLHADDMADALCMLMEKYEGPEPINIGAGQDQTISELAMLMKKVTGFKGQIVYDAEKPDGTPKKLMDSSRIGALGWRPRISLEEGLSGTYKWASENQIFS